MHVPVLLLAIGCAAALPAQSDRFTAHPQANPHVSSFQGITLGSLVSWCEARTQFQMFAKHLPGPGAVLVGIEVFPHASGAVTYESLEITVSPVPASTPRSQTFDTNLPVPFVVLQLANHTETWTAGGWQRLALSPLYVHDGASDLTIDIKKKATVSTNFGACRAGQRPDLAPVLAAYGGPGSGLHTATTATATIGCIDVRLVWSGAPTSWLRSPVPSVGHHGFAIGSTFDHVVTGTPSSLAAIAYDVQWPAPVVLPFAAGEWRAQAGVLGVDVLDANGEAVRAFATPNAPALVGQQLVFQALVLDALTSQFVFTNGSDCFLAQ